MEISTFNDDLLDLSAFAARLETFLNVERHFVTGSLVVALNSEFGFGKSTFLKMWTAEIKSRESSDNPPMVIALNAWESDYYGDPLFAIISGLTESLQRNGRTPTALINAAKDLGWFATAVGGQIAKKFTGVDAFAAKEITEKQKAKRTQSEGMPLDAFSDYQRRRRAMDHLKKTIKLFVENANSNVLFLVDELDRCRPDYAITYLETIKHIFDIEGATFVLAADRQHLENSAKTAFGRDLDFDEYYRKFVHREVTLPPISENGFRKLAAKYVNYYLTKDDVRECTIAIDRHLIDRVVELVESLKMTPRQIQEMFRILGHVFETRNPARRIFPWCCLVGTLALAAFKVADPKHFDLLGNGQMAPQDAVNYLHSLFGNGNIHWWFMLFLTGGGLRVNGDKDLTDVMKDVGLLAEGEEALYQPRIDQHDWGWPYQIDKLSQIHEKIEHVAKWD